MFDIFGAIKSIADLAKELVLKLLKTTPEKIQNDRYNAEKNFKEFMNDVKDEENSRTSDLKH